MACGKMMNLEEDEVIEGLAFELFKFQNDIFDLRNRIKCLEMIQERREIMSLKESRDLTNVNLMKIHNRLVDLEKKRK